MAPSGRVENVGTPPPALAFVDFYESEYRRLVRLGYVLTGSPPVAEELAQETLLRAFRHWRKVARYDRPGAWARRVLCNLAVSRGRRLQAEARARLRLHSHAVTEAEPDPQAAELWHALRRLQARQAQTLALFYFEDLPVREIAAVLECAEGTVKALLHRGRQTLARELGDHADTEDGTR